MASDVEAYRRWAARQAAEAIGQDIRQNRTNTLGVKVQGHEGEIVALPEEPGDCQPVQIWDTSSPDFGKFWFMAGYDMPGDANHPVR